MEVLRKIVIRFNTTGRGLRSSAGHRDTAAACWRRRQGRPAHVAYDTAFFISWPEHLGGGSVELRLRETASELYGFLSSLEAEPRRLEGLEASLDKIALTKRRFRCETYEELLARAAAARAELAALEDGNDPGNRSEQLGFGFIHDQATGRRLSLPARVQAKGQPAAV